MNEDVFGETVLVLFADQHGHAVDHIDEDIVLQHHCGNGVAKPELDFLVDAKAQRQEEDRIDHQKDRCCHPQHQRRARQLQRAPAACLRDQKFTIDKGAVEYPHHRHKRANRDGDGQPERDHRHRHDQEITERRAPVDHKLQNTDCLKQPHDADKRQRHGKCRPQKLVEKVAVKLHVMPL